MSPTVALMEATATVIGLLSTVVSSYAFLLQFSKGTVRENNCCLKYKEQQSYPQYKDSETTADSWLEISCLNKQHTDLPMEKNMTTTKCGDPGGKRPSTAFVSIMARTAYNTRPQPQGN